MLSTPFNLLISKNLNILSDTLKRRQTFAEKLKKETQNFNEKNKIKNEPEICSILEGKNDGNLQMNVFEWLSVVSLDERIKICTIQDRWLTSILIQMYLLFEKNNEIKFEPNEEMKVFFASSNSLNSFKLLNNQFSPNDEKKISNEKEGEEISHKPKEIEPENYDLFFYKKFFSEINVEKEQKENNEEKENIIKEFIETIKIISLEKDNDLDTIIISSDLLSNLEKFRRFFKFFSNDNYFKEWLYPYQSENSFFNFYMPIWMRGNNVCFSFCQLIIGFIEQHILLNYEYFYLTNKIYELPYHKKILKIYKQNKNLQILINKMPKKFRYMLSENNIENLVNKVLNAKNCSEINTKIKEMCNKVYLEKYNYLLFDKNPFSKDELSKSIFKELEYYFENINKKNTIEKFIDIISFLGFKEVIKFRHLFFFYYKKIIINCLKKILKREEEKKNKINKINEIHNHYSINIEEENDSDDRLVRNTSKTTAALTTQSKNKELSIYEDDDSFSLNSETSIIVVQNQINKNINIPYNKSSNNNSINNNIPDKIFSINCNSFYDKAINDYCIITNNNLKALHSLYVEKLEIIEKIIKENLQDKFEITFGHYGSFFTGLSIEGSDIDICIYYKPKENKIDFFKELYELLKKQKPLLYEINIIDSFEMSLFKLKIDITEDVKNKIPLYNYLDYEDLTKIKIDITFNQNKEYLDNCEKNVDYIKNEIKNYPQIKPVLLYLKRYFKKMDMNKVFYGGTNSFSLFLLILNVIKSEQRDDPNNYIGNFQLLYLVLKKFSSFNFEFQGIGKDSYDYNLEFINKKGNLYILSPLNERNVASSRCNAIKITKTFLNAFNIITYQITLFKNAFNTGYNPFNQIPINFIIALFNSQINFLK